MDNFFNNKLPNGTGPYNCPPKGVDSRHLTSYISTNEMAEIMKYTFKLNDNQDFNTFIQTQGDKIINNLNEYHKQNSSCFPNICTNNYPTKITIQQMKNQMDDFNNKWKSNYVNGNCIKHKEYKLN